MIKYEMKSSACLAKLPGVHGCEFGFSLRYTWHSNNYNPVLDPFDRAQRGVRYLLQALKYGKMMQYLQNFPGVAICLDRNGRCVFDS